MITQLQHRGLKYKRDSEQEGVVGGGGAGPNKFLQVHIFESWVWSALKVEIGVALFESTLKTRV